MIIGAHIIIQSKNATADQAFLKGLSLPSVSMDASFSIYGLPPSEVAIHSSNKNDVHELYLMCDDVAATVRSLNKAGIATSPVLNRGWGLLTTLTLPGGGKLGVYEPLHPRPKQHVPGKSAKKKVAAKPAKKKAVKKTRKAKRR